jgi:hypothetical protein
MPPLTGSTSFIPQKTLKVAVELHISKDVYVMLAIYVHAHLGDSRVINYPGRVLSHRRVC